MITFLLCEKNQAIITENANGLATLKLANREQAISQNTKLRLLVIKRGREYEPAAAIDWFKFEDPALAPLLAQSVRSLIVDTEGVDSADISKAMYSLKPFKLSGICFTMSCGTQSTINL